MLTDPEKSMDVFDPFAPELIATPYAQYHRLRSEDPVHWSPPLRAWVLTRMDDVRAALKNKDFEAMEFSGTFHAISRKTGRGYDALVDFLDAVLFCQDGAEHRRQRRVVARALNRFSLSTLEPVIEDIASSLANKLPLRSEYDAITEFADPLPHYVMAHILGLPPPDALLLSALVADMTLSFDAMPLRIYDSINRKVAAALDLLASRITDAAKTSEETGLSIIYDAAEGTGDEKLRRAAATALFTFRVGAETTVGMLGLLINTLVDQPKLRQSARETPSLGPLIVSEVLRREGNVQRSARICRKECVIGGKTIRAGDRVLLLLGSANRDPAVFPEPDELVLQQRNVQDVVFGGGSHFCLGAGLAFLEGRIALEHFLRLPPIERAGDVEWYAGRSIRRLTRLPVRFVSVSEEVA